MTEPRTGKVTHDYNHLPVAGVAITDGEPHIGNTIHVEGHTSDFGQKVESMEIDNDAVDIARPHDQIARTVTEHAGEHDTAHEVI